MPFTRPALATLITQAKTYIKSHLTGDDPFLRRCVEGTVAEATAGLTHGLYGMLVWLSKQLLPDTADIDWLIRWASIYGLTRSPAVKAQLTVAITGTNSTTCPAATLWADATGVQYTQDADVTIAGGVGTASVTAVVAGVAGNQVSGAVLSLVSPVTGINSAGSVSTTTATGFDLEAPATLLARLLLRLQTPPKGGGPGDYESWALAVSGVTRAWEFPRANGAGTVVVRFVCDDLPVIIPDASVVAVVQAYLETKAPVAAGRGPNDVGVLALAPTGSDLDFSIDLSVGADTAAIRAAVVANLTDMMLQKATPEGVTLYLAWIEDAIATATGVTNYTLNSPTASQVYAVGTMPLMGAVVFA
jgi:uncharacterized phage protein gp47/JayE